MTLRATWSASAAGRSGFFNLGVIGSHERVLDEGFEGGEGVGSSPEVTDEADAPFASFAALGDVAASAAALSVTGCARLPMAAHG